MYRITRLAVLAAIVAAAPLAASARSSYLSSFNSKYGTASTALDSCNLCHPSGTSSFNAYANDLRAAGISTNVNAAFTAAEPKDSDGDGYTNITEINARSHPGDSRSVPAPAPAPAIAVAPTSLAFGTVTVGSPSTLNLTVSNGGTATLTVGSISRCSGTSGEFTASPAALTVAAGGRATVAVSYAPTAAGTDGGCIALANNSATPNVQVNVSGTGEIVVAPSPHVSVAPASLSFGTVTVGSAANQTTVVSNSGDGDLVVSSVARCTGTSAEFTASPASFTVAAGGSQTVTVTYRPVDATVDGGCIAVASNDTGAGTVNVGVGGTGQAQANPVVDVDVTRFSAAKRLDISRGGTATPKVAVVNAGTAAGTATIQLEGSAPDANGVPQVLYTASEDVTLAPATTTKVLFPTFVPTASGIVTWTVTVADQDPDVDAATATTKIVP